MEETNEKRTLLATLTDKTDRELIELQVYYAYQTRKSAERIKNNVVFFFWLFLASIAAGLIMVMSMPRAAV